MAFGSTLKDSGGVPISQEYVPNTGFIALGGHPGAAKDANSNQYTAATMHYIQPSVVQQANAVTGSAGKTLNVVFGAATTQGNTIIVVLGMGEVQTGATITLAVTDSQSNAYTQAAFASQSTTLEASIFSALVATAGATTVTITIAGASSTNTAIAAQIYEIAGLVPHASGGVLDQTATSNNAGSTAVSAGAVTPAQGNEYAFVAIAAGGGTITAGTGLTLDSGTLAPTGGGLVSFGSEHGYLAGQAVLSGTATLSASNAWAAAIATFRTAVVPISGSTGSLAVPDITIGVISARAINGNVYGCAASAGLFFLPMNLYFPCCIFNPAGSGKTLSLYSILLYFFTNAGTTASPSNPFYSLNPTASDPNFASTMSVAGWKPGSPASVAHATYNASGQAGQAGSSGFGGVNLPFGQQVFQEVLTNGTIIVVAPGQGFIIQPITLASSGNMFFGVQFLWMEY